MNRHTRVLVLAGALGLSGGLSAQGIESTAGLGLEVGGGYYWLDGDRNLEDGGFGGLGAEIRTNSGLAFNLWWLTTQDLNMDGLDEQGRPQGDGKADNWRGDITYYFSNGRWQPYLALGINRLFVDYDIDGGSWTTQGNLGVGLKVHMSPGWYARMEARGYRGGDHLNDVTASISIGYLFGQKAKAAPVVAAVPVAAAVAAAPVGDSDGDGVNDDVDQCPNTIQGALIDSVGCGVKLTGAHFKFDSDELNPDAKAVLDELAARMGEYPDIKLRVEGHTDASGEEAYNVDLSQRRAQAAADYLVGKGVSDSRFEVEGLGSAKPVESNDTQEGRAANRRVVFIKQ